MLIVTTAHPESFIHQLSERIAQGDFDQWDCDDGETFRYRGSGGQWFKEGKLIAEASNGKVVISFKPDKLTKSADAAVALLQSRFLELLATGFVSEIKSVEFIPAP